MHPSKSMYVERMALDLSEDFATILDIPNSIDIERVTSMALHTMLHDIALNFRNGEFAKEILEAYGVDAKRILL